MKLNKEKTIETIFILIFVGIMLWIGLADSWGHRIQHSYPYSYLASDTFQHQTRAQWIKDTGNYRFEAPYYSAEFTDIVGFYPPILNHLSVLFSHASGLEVYDTIILLTVLFAITGTLIFYFIFRAWNIHIALLSLPLAIYIFTIREARLAFFWGHWSALLGDFFFVSVCWLLFNLGKKYSAVFLAILLSGTILGHTAATVFSLLFIIIFLSAFTIAKGFCTPQLKKIAFAFVLTLVVSFYFLIIFKQSWMIIYPFTFTIETDWASGGGFVQLQHFGPAALIIIALGFIILIFSKTTLPNNDKSNFFQKLCILFAVFAGLTNYIGFNLRAFNFRFYWPITLSPLFGICVYTFLKRLRPHAKLLTTAILSLLVIIVILKFNYQPTGAIEGLMNPYTWQTLNWIKDNTPKDSQPFFFYGDPYDQDGSLGNTNRNNARVEIAELTKTLEKRTLERNYSVKYLIEAGAGLPYKKRMFSYGLRAIENNVTNKKITDLCSFDYYIFDKIGRFQPFTQLNYLITNTFAQNNFTLVFENALNIILKNNNKGGTCLGANNNLTF